MTANLSFNPMIVTNPGNLFDVGTVGFVQGEMEPDPAYVFAINRGLLATSETLPMYGGIALYTNVPVSTSGGVLGGNVGRATTAATISAFAIQNRFQNAIVTPQGSAPAVGSGQSVTYVPLGSNARIVVQCDAGLASTLSSGTASSATQVSWDFGTQKLVPYTPTYTTVTITGATWASTAGGQTTFTVSTNLTSALSAGSVINVTGVVSSSAAGVFNGDFVVVSVTSTTVVVTQVAASNPGTYTSGGTITAGGGALACKILGVNSGNSQIIYLDSNNVPQWNQSGTAALIQI